MENKDLEVNCVHYISEKDFCTIYKKAHPPQKVCAMCKNFKERENIRDCSRFESLFEDYCVHTDGVDVVYRKKPDACKYCQWPEDGRFDLFKFTELEDSVNI